MKPIIVYVSGAPGSGKTTLAKLLSEQLYIPHLSSDLIHGGVELTEPNHDRKSTIEGVFIPLMVDIAQKKVSFVVDHVLQKELAKATIIDTLQNVATIVYVHVQCADPIRRYIERVQTSIVPDVVRRRDLLLERAEWHRKNLDNTAAPLKLDLPTIVINTDDGYNPGLDKIISFVKGQIDQG
jgi:adenylate kinase family enzyme